MKSNIVILDLDIYQKEVEAKAEALTKLREIEKELDALTTLIEDLKRDKELISKEFQELLDVIIKDDQVLYEDKIWNFNVKDNTQIAEFLTEKDYMKLINEIKERKEAKNNE